MARRRSIHPPPKVPLSESEQVQARLLSRWALRLAVRQEAADLLLHGADPDQLHDLRVSCTAALCGPDAAWQWGVTSTTAIEQARRRVREAGLVDTALYLAVLYDTGLTAPPPTYLGHMIFEHVPGAGLAWPPGSGVDPTIKVQRWPEPEQMELWDEDGVPWVEWSAMRAEDAALSGAR